MSPAAPAKRAHYDTQTMALPLIYNWRNLFVRKSSTLLTFGVVALIVFVLTWALAFGEGLQDSLKAGGALDKLILIKPGATGESTSFLSLEEYRQLHQLPHLARTASGEPAVSGEVVTQTSLPRRNDPSQLSLVAVRGVETIAFYIHKNVRIVQGRIFNQGADEIVVGKSIVDRVEGVQIGGTLALGFDGGRPFTVVGIFEAAGGPMESEIWCSLSPIRDVFNRESMVSSVALRLDDAAQAPALIEQLRNPPYSLQARTEQQYYQDLADRSSQILGLTLILVAFMALGACFAVANTIYAAVDGRTKEIAMLRTIGYTPRMIVSSFIIEAVFICGIACLIGAALACFALTFTTKQEFLSDATWSTFAYEMKVTPRILILSLGAALLVGFIGAIVPAWKASRMNILSAIRRA